LGDDIEQIWIVFDYEVSHFGYTFIEPSST